MLAVCWPYVSRSVAVSHPNNPNSECQNSERQNSGVFLGYLPPNFGSPNIGTPRYTVTIIEYSYISAYLSKASIGPHIITHDTQKNRSK